MAFYKNAYGGKFGVYKISDCVPMKARTTKPPSEKQKRARAILSVKAKLKSNEAKASCKANQWLDENSLFLDSETTGIDDKAQILELAISMALYLPKAWNSLQLQRERFNTIQRV
ncbi:TPA: hypothetical protein ACMDWD_003441 [Vibrio cholerae]